MLARAACGLVCVCAPLSSRAVDRHRAVRPGIDLLHRTTDQPQDIWAARIDLTVPNIGIHASADNAQERHVTTPTFARNTDAVVAINADWSDSRTPVGLAIADGTRWHNHIPDNTVGGQWGYFACKADKTCTLGWELPTDAAWWFTAPEGPPYRYFEATGTNGIPMIVEGRRAHGCFDAVRNPRTALCLEPDGTHLWLLVVDGRRAGAAGMTCDEIRDLMLDLGCTQGAMLDGGGSSTMVVEDVVKNQPSDGSPRTVSNHIGITYADPMDGRCDVGSGRFCTGATIATCEGGRFLGSGDCAFYGASCEEDGAWAYCVNPGCPGGRGQGAECSGPTTVHGCSDGVLASPDANCGAFGLVCGTDTSGSACMEARCQAGPNSAFCASGALAAACASGVYAETPCGAGTHCDGGSCVGDGPPPPPPDAAPPPPPTPDAAAVRDAWQATTDAGSAPGEDAGPMDAAPPRPGEDDVWRLVPTDAVAPLVHRDAGAEADAAQNGTGPSGATGSGGGCGIAPAAPRIERTAPLWMAAIGLMAWGRRRSRLSAR